MIKGISEIFPFVQFDYMPLFDVYSVTFTHRDIMITEYLQRHNKDYDHVLQFIILGRKEINYYLDAIWC